MPLCPVCGGNIASNEQNCPYCGKTQLHLGDEASNSSEWDLPMEDNTSVIAPWAATTEQPPPPPAAEDWLLPEAMLDSPPAPPAASIPSADVSLPPWAPVSPPAQVTREPTTFDFDFDQNVPSSESLIEPKPPAAPPPAPAANVQLPVWQPPAANASYPAPPPPVSPVPVMPVPVTPVAPPPAYVAPAPPPVFTPSVVPPIPAPPAPTAPAVGRRICPSCGKTFGAEYNDSFCLCGAELVEAPPPPAPAPPPPQPPAKRAAPQRPPAGTRCLVLYGADKQPVHYFALSKDAMLVGRLDAASGCFPDIDVSEYVDESTARKVSRKHALILRSRSSDSFTLRALPGNTGTQVEKRMLAGSEEVPLMPGMRLVLGGAVRFKFEVM